MLEALYNLSINFESLGEFEKSSECLKILKHQNILRQIDYYPIRLSIRKITLTNEMKNKLENAELAEIDKAHCILHLENIMKILKIMIVLKLFTWE